MKKTIATILLVGILIAGIGVGVNHGISTLSGGKPPRPGQL